MADKKYLFISFNHSKAYVFNPINNTVKDIPLHLLSNLSHKHHIICCNKILLRNTFTDQLLKNSFKDILYLYAFLYPTRFSSNTIQSLNFYLNISSNFSKELSYQAITLYNIYNKLIEDLKNFNSITKSYILDINFFIGKTMEWDWYHDINNLLNDVKLNKQPIRNLLMNFPDCEINRKTSPNTNKEVSSSHILINLNSLTKHYNKKRLAQQKYALTVSKMFSPYNSAEKDLPSEEPKTNIVLAEAGTGIGKTLGYVAATLSYLKVNPNNNVVISTFSKNLQQQILKEINKAISTNLLDIKVTLIKGTHNYICLLNVDNILANIDVIKDIHFIGIILRWLQETQYGDIYGGDLLPWIKDLIPQEIIYSISNKKEECIYSKCPYYKKCFITKIKESAKHSNIIISNHTLTLKNNFKTDYIIFDEAHNLYNVSDDTYAKELSGKTGLLLRNWLLGQESNSRVIKNSSLNGLQTRLNNLLLHINRQEEESKSYINPESTPENMFLTQDYPLDSISQQEVLDLQIKNLLKTLMCSANILPKSNYIYNINQHTPHGIFEEFLYNINKHVLLTNSDLNQYYTLESTLNNLSNDFINSAEKLAYNLKDMLNTALALKEVLIKKLESITHEVKSNLLEFIKNYEYNCINVLKDFIDLLFELKNNSPDHIYRLVIIKEEQVVTNIGYIKNYINPLKILNEEVLYGKKGVTFTSATLFNESIKSFNKEELLSKFSLDNKKARLIKTVQLYSPFNYIKNSKIIILNRNYSSNSALRNEALLQLFLAAKGGVLTLFTSLVRLKQHYNFLKDNYLLKEKEIPILAPNNNKTLSTLIDLFKEDEASCLLGSDSFRDGIDIPGKSLRMVIFEKVPWLKKDILNSARKLHYGKNIEIDNIKLRLKQGFGRLIRSENDKGVFILLEPGLPSHFLDAFPKGVEIQKISLEEAVKQCSSFLEPYI